MATWFTADPHFGHANIIRLCGRPYATVGQMDRDLLDRLRARVGPEDDLWVIGDFAAQKADNQTRRRVAEIFSEIPGNKHLIRGNHDSRWILDLPWESQADLADIPVDGGRAVLCHYPMITFPGSRRGALNLFGHVHQNWAGSRNSVNVGVDQFGFDPVSFAEARARAETLPVNAHWNQVEPGCAWLTELCAGCGAILDPALVFGHATVRNGRIVIARTGEVIVSMGDRMREWLQEGQHVCPECIGGYLSVGEVTVPAGMSYDEMLNRSMPNDSLESQENGDEKR